MGNPAKSIGPMLGTRLGSELTVHTYPVNFNTTGIASAILVDTIRATTQEPVQVEVSIQVVTAFNAVTTNVLTVGTSSTATEWLAAPAATEGTTGYYPANSTKSYTTLGSNGAGAITVTGAEVGDVVTGAVGITAGTLGDLSAGFEAVVTVAGQIQQSGATDYSAKAILFTLNRNAGSGRNRVTADTGIWVKYTQTGTAATTGAAVVIVKTYAENRKAIA